MHFSILGQISVRDGAPIEIPRTRRPLLAALLLAWPGEVSAETLMEAAWGDAVGRENSLKTALSQLRRLLQGRVPPARTHAYRIEMGPEDSFDLTAYRRLAEQGRRHIAAGDHPAAVSDLQRALDLWGDPPLADVPDDPLRLATWRAELLWERKVTQQTLLESRLLLGEHHRLLPEIRRELAGDPLSEPLNALLMTALYRAGYRVEALHHYDLVATLLARDTGAEPGARLRQLRDDIAADNVGEPIAGRGAVRGPHSPVTAGSRPLAQLPPAVMDFVGRGAEAEQLGAHLSATGAGMPIGVVWGPPGVGKSTLAFHVAHVLRPAFPDGQIYVHMAGTSDRPRDTAEVLGEVLSALGVSLAELPATVSGRSALYRSLMAGRRVLVLLDDVCGMHQAHPLLPGAPGCAALLTSRSYLAATTSIRAVRLGPLSRQESLNLLGDIIGKDRVQAESAAAANIADLCSGFPLAVRVAGARLSAQQDRPLRTFAQQLRRRRMSMLTTEEVAVEASISDSYDALPEHARRIFRLISLLGPAGFASWEVAMLGQESEEKVEQALDLLTQQSLLTTIAADALGQPRYRQHGLLRTFGADRLAALPDDRDVAIYRLLLGWLELVSLADAHVVRDPCHPPAPSATFRLSMFGPASARRLIADDANGWLAAEVGNLLNVVRVASDQHLHLQAMGLALRVSSYLVHQGRYDDAEDMWRRLLQHVAPVNARWAAEARHRLAQLILRQPGGACRALPLLDQCVKVWETLADRHGAPRSLTLRSHCWRRIAAASDLDDDRAEYRAKAEADAERGLDMARTAKNAHAELLALRALALAVRDQGRHEEALDLGSQAVAVAARLAVRPAHQTYLALALLTQGQATLAARRPREALDCFEHAARLSRQAQHRVGQARAEGGIGDALTALARHDRAGEHYARAEALCDGEGWSEHVVPCQAELLILPSEMPANC